MAADEDKRSGLSPLTPDDLLRREELGHAAFSPDGRWLAYVVRRARSTTSVHLAEFLHGDDRGDVWVVKKSGGTPRNLTHGERDGAGSWAPIWSPGSDRLALLSSRGANVCVWIWDAATGDVERLCEDGVDLHSHAPPMLWMSDRELLVATLPEGERPSRLVAEFQAAEIAMREWPKAWKGIEPTASVLDSGGSEPFEQRPQGALLLIDVVSGDRRTLLTGFFREMRLAPGGRHAAFVRVVGVRPPDAERELERPRAEIGELAGVSASGVLTAGVREIAHPQSMSLRWSADGDELALIGRDGTSCDAPRRVFRYRPADGRIQAVTDATLCPGPIVWTGDGALLVLASPADDADGPRADWWLFEEGCEPRMMAVQEGCAAPTELVSEVGRRAFVGLAGRDVVRLEPGDGRWTNLTEGRGLTIVWLLWPRRTPDDRTFAQLLLAADGAQGRTWHSLDLQSGELSVLPTPSIAGWLADFDPERGTALPVVIDRTGTRMWLSKPALGRHELVVETNTWLTGIAEGDVRRVDYQGPDGRELRAWLILPVGYEPGMRCPMITEVYPNHVISGDSAPMMTLSLTGHHAHSPQLLAARGYAVLLPSMPPGPSSEPGEPGLGLTDGVLPAIDKLIELGIAEPDRLGVFGHSLGGYATYGLICETHRFRAAVALAGLSDLVGLHGQFDARHRYDAYAHEICAAQYLTEADPLRMGVPPWRDPERYVRNSPLFGVDRVQTPLLIIQGDMDYVPLQQGEQFFSALYREGKRARFVRYWGEGHVLQSPANIRDMWQQIYAWFDELLA